MGQAINTKATVIQTRSTNLFVRVIWPPINEGSLSKYRRPRSFQHWLSQHYRINDYLAKHTLTRMPLSLAPGGGSFAVGLLKLADKMGGVHPAELFRQVGNGNVGVLQLSGGVC